MRTKNIKKSSNKKIFIIVFIFLIVLLLVLLLLPKNNNEDDYIEDIYTGWMKYSSRNDYMKIPDYSTNICNINYYSPSFEIDKDNNLYNYSNEVIAKDIFSLMSIRYAECESTLVFASSLDGKLYYINNFKHSSDDKYQLTEIDNVSEITNISADNDQVFALDINEKEENITNQVEKIVRK